MHIHLYTHIHTHTFIYTHSYTHSYTYIHTHTFIHTTHSYINIHTHSCIHIIHTHSYTHILLGPNHVFHLLHKCSCIPTHRQTDIHIYIQWLDLSPKSHTHTFEWMYRTEPPKPIPYFYSLAFLKTKILRKSPHR